ncbi:MAG: NAD(P)/FAD-dependent oxidoreductase [Caldilineales bacterium]
MPHVSVYTVEMRFEEKVVALRNRAAPGEPLFRIVRRNEYDARLAAIAQARGIEIRQNTALTGLARADGGVRLKTSRGELTARVVVGADGAKSSVRRWMNLSDGGQPARVSRLLEVLTAEDAATSPEFVQGRAVFDFTPAQDGVQGYCWDFPSYVDGRAMMNRGVFDSRVRPERRRADLTAALDSYLRDRRRSLTECELHGHPERWYDPRGTYAVPHILLAGDAAGVDPLLGEGIAWALQYGPVAAAEVRNAFASGDFSFSGYSRRLRRSAVGANLTDRVRLARLLYSVDRRRLRLTWPLIGPIGRYLEWRLRRETAGP